jgi:hypothetical protein
MSAEGNKMGFVFRGEKGKLFRFSKCETESRLFMKFMRGLELRMSRNIQSNIEFDHNILLSINRSHNR